MNLRTRVISGSLLAGAILCGPGWAGAKTGWLCEACTSVEAAREQARQHAPALQCNTTVGDTGQPVLDPDGSFECQAPPAKQVVLANREIHQVYVFEVNWQLNGEIWEVVVTDSSLSAEYLDLAYTALDVTEAWSQAIIDINDELATEAGINSVNSAGKYSAGTMSDPEPLDCPQDTLLRTLMDQSKMDSLKRRLRTEIELEIDRIISDGGAGVDSSSITVSRGGLTFGFNISESGRPIPTGIERMFTQREVNLNEDPPTGPGMPVLDYDRLVFSARAVNMGDSSRAILTLEPGASTILGLVGDDFFDGREVTDPCALDALALGDDHGQFRFRDGGGIADPEQTFGTGGGSGGASGGDTSRMCLYDFYSNDTYQFSFWAPCGSAGENEEIQD
ncbi:MAG: hypothetical protein WD397_06750 [Wenzhouxiangellaceae bacterium]